MLYLFLASNHPGMLPHYILLNMYAFPVDSAAAATANRDIFGNQKYTRTDGIYLCKKIS